VRKYKGNPDNQTIHMAVELAWSSTKDALKEYTSVYSIEDVIKLYDKHLLGVSGILPNGLLKKRRARFEEMLQSNKEFQELKDAIANAKIRQCKTNNANNANNVQLNIW